MKSADEAPQGAGQGAYGNMRMSAREFDLLSEFVQREAGIKMPPLKRNMLEGRLLKRLRVLGMASFSEYCGYLFSPTGSEAEVPHMLDAVTTHKTEFFREPAHLDWLTEKVLPALIAEGALTSGTPLAVWSAGCSTGEEPYTLAMVLSDFFDKLKGFGFFVLGTDISERALEAARTAIYEEHKIAPVPPACRERYLLRSRDSERRLVRVAPSLRALVRFRHLNLMSRDYGLREAMDVIFCRNVLIYFERNTQEKLLNHFCMHLKPGGFIFLGHSENLIGLDVPLDPSGPTVYRKAA